MAKWWKCIYKREGTLKRRSVSSNVFLKQVAYPERSLPTLALERELQAQLFASDDATEGLNAYIEKRKAEFQGK